MRGNETDTMNKEETIERREAREVTGYLLNGEDYVGV